MYRLAIASYIKAHGYIILLILIVHVELALIYYSLCESSNPTLKKTIIQNLYLFILTEFNGHAVL